MKLILIPVLLVVSTHAWSSECAKLVAQAESQMSEVVAQKANAACAKEKVKTARAHIVLSKIAFNEGGYDDVIKHSNNALLEEPGLPLAHMNKCAAYQQMSKFDEAIASCKEALKKSSPWESMINFNTGLAIYSKHVNTGEFKKLTEAEPYFLASSKLDPKIDQNYFFLGLISQGGKNDPKSALGYYTKGCSLGHQKSCDQKSQAALEASEAEKANAEAASGKAKAATEAAAAAKASKIDPKVEAALWKEMEKNYLAKGVPADAVKGIIDSSKESVNAASPDQRLKLIQELVQASK